MWVRPFTRLAPPVSYIFFMATGLPSSVLLGATVSVKSERTKRARPASGPKQPPHPASALLFDRGSQRVFQQPVAVAQVPAAPRRLCAVLRQAPLQRQPADAACLPAQLALGWL